MTHGLLVKSMSHEEVCVKRHVKGRLVGLDLKLRLDYERFKNSEKCYQSSLLAEFGEVAREEKGDKNPSSRLILFFCRSPVGDGPLKEEDLYAKFSRD